MEAWIIDCYLAFPTGGFSLRIGDCLSDCNSPVKYILFGSLLDLLLLPAFASGMVYLRNMEMCRPGNVCPRMFSLLGVLSVL